MKRKIVYVPMRPYLHCLKRGMETSVRLECGHWETANRTAIRRGWCYCFDKGCNNERPDHEGR